MDFPLEEYQLRVKRAQELMEKHGYDALMVTGDLTASHNYRYFTGHMPRDYQANSARTHIFLLTKDGDCASCVNYYSEAPARQAWVENIHVYTQPYSYKDALKIFEMLGIKSGKVAVELGLDTRMMMPFGDFEQLKSALPKVEWVDAGPLIWQLRIVKTQEEIEAIRIADDINHRALERTFGEAKIGMTERELYDLCVHALIDEGSNAPPFAQMTITSSARYRGKGLVTFFSGPTDEPLLEGDIVFIDSGALHKGYWGEFNRMATMGQPSPEQEEWHKLIRDIVQGFIEDVLRPGITCEQAMQEALGLYEKAGMGRDQYIKYAEYPYLHLCHGLGLQASELPLVRLTDQTVIEEGTVFSVEAYLQGHDIQYGSEEDVVVRDGGNEVLSQMDHSLYVIG